MEIAVFELGFEGWIRYMDRAQDISVLQYLNEVVFSGIGEQGMEAREMNVELISFSN